MEHVKWNIIIAGEWVEGEGERASSSILFFKNWKKYPNLVKFLI